jgi:hypothetical protein
MTRASGRKGLPGVCELVALRVGCSGAWGRVRSWHVELAACRASGKTRRWRWLLAWVCRWMGARGTLVLVFGGVERELGERGWWRVIGSGDVRASEQGQAGARGRAGAWRWAGSCSEVAWRPGAERGGPGPGSVRWSGGSGCDASSWGVALRGSIRGEEVGLTSGME